MEEISKTQIRRDLYGFLLAVRRNIHAIDKRSPHNRRYPLQGICGLVKNELNTTTAGDKYAGWAGRTIIRKELVEGFKAWPKFSHDPVFPVPSGGKRAPEDMYTSGNSNWDVNRPGSKRYAKLRRELLDFLIDYFKE